MPSIGFFASMPFLAAAASCSSPEASTDARGCTTGFLGDGAQAPNLRIQVLLADQTVVPIDDGASVPLLFPPQGGRVIFVGVRATNIDGCAVKLTGALRDPSSRQVRFESRTINLTPTGDGWGQSGLADATHSVAIGSFANVPVCPNEWATADVYGQPYDLEVTIEDRSKRTSTKTIRVTPECAEPANAAECTCICKANYILGQACAEPDAGSTDAGDGA